MSVPSLLYNFSNKETLDWYSFIKNGLTVICDSREEIVRRLKSNYQQGTDIVKYYVASYKAPKDGRVGEMIAGFIMFVINNDYIGGYKYIETFMKKENGIYQYV